MDNIEKTKKALRYNEGKLKWSLVHYASITPLVLVLMFGAKKYAPHNWKNEMDLTEILESLQRHLTAIFDGELVDKESGQLHMGHVRCRLYN